MNSAFLHLGIYSSVAALCRSIDAACLCLFCIFVNNFLNHMFKMKFGYTDSVPFSLDTSPVCCSFSALPF